MAVQVSCGKCKQIIRAEEQFFGKTVKCPNCQTHLAIPDPQQQAAQPADPLVGKTVAHYQVEGLLGQAYYCEKDHNPYLSPDDPGLPADHPRNAPQVSL